MLHLDDQTMPIYQQKIEREIKDFQYRLQALRREAKDVKLRSGRVPQQDLDQLDADLRAAQRKLNQIVNAPGEMRDRLRDQLDTSLVELRTSLAHVKTDDSSDDQ
jgi:hypothetical protein